MNRFRTCLTCSGFFTAEVRDSEFCSQDCEDREIILVSADSGTIGMNGRGATGITWSYCLVGKKNVLLEHKTGFNKELKTSPQGECQALLEGLERLPDGWEGTVESDCLYALKVIFQTDYWDGYVWKDKKLDKGLKERRNKLKERLDFSKIKLVLLSGHPTTAERAAKVARNGRPVSEWNVKNDEACTDLNEKVRNGKI